MSRLDADRIRGSIDAAIAARLAACEVFAAVESTNSYLMQKPAVRPGTFAVAVTDNQTAGRGRHGRQWRSPPGSGVALSLAYTFETRPPNLAAVTLAIGIGAVSGFERLGIAGVGLKWPNDLVAGNAKLGGILTETMNASGPSISVVAGLGVNVRLGDGFDLEGERQGALRPTDLAAIAGEPPAPDALVAGLINGVCGAILDFEADGFAPFASRWKRHDWLLGRRLSVDTGRTDVVGTGAGLAEDGALLVDTGDGRLERVVSGSVTA